MRPCKGWRTTCTKVASRFRLQPRATRPFTTQSHERAEVRCGSSGYVTVDIFNLHAHPVDVPVVLHLPPYPQVGEPSEAEVVEPPDFLQDWPVASINYRWDEAQGDRVSQQWPTPIHDAAFAYSWVVEQLAPPFPARRKMYAYGSYLGASLATSLALTETQPHLRFGIKGVVAFNGVYNWTMFLPSHPIHSPKTKRKVDSLLPPQLAHGSHLERIEDLLPELFKKPADLFDPFASPSLFFHNPGVLAPKSFDALSPPSAVDEMISMLTADQAGDSYAEELLLPKQPRKSHLVYPPRTSALKIPETLLLYDSIPQKLSKRGKPLKRQPRGHNLEAQAEELADLMRRSVDKVELKARRNWDEEMEDLVENEAERRVQVRDVGVEGRSDELSRGGQDLVTTWLRDRAAAF